MSVPPALGDRLPFADLPAHVRAAVDARLSATVVGSQDQPGGLSPGCAVRLLLADGRRVFVKAAGTQLNPDTPALYRREGAALARLPTAIPAPTLRWTFDDGDWVALCLDEIRGRCPAVPWASEDIDVTMRALDALARTPILPEADAFPTVRELQADDFGSWTQIRATLPADLDDWSWRHLDRLDGLAASVGPAAVMGDSLVHLDIRADNVVIDAERRVWILDWTWTSTGAPWIDSVIFALYVAREGAHDPQAVLDRSQAARDTAPELIDALLATLAGSATVACRKPSHPSMPTVRAFQRSYANTAIAWLARRTGWP